MKQRRLHLVLLDPQEVPYAETEYVLTVGRTEHCGRTAADGSLSHEVPGLAAGELLVKLSKPPAPPPRRSAPPAATKGAPPPYPPAVTDEDFPDATPTAASEPVTLRWALQLQSLPGFESDALRAAQERLHNLGYAIEGERGSPGASTKSAVRAFQRRHGLPETGQLADISRELIRLHDA
ncbi:MULTISPECIES: peptidoglycan-binding domain-containing protein [Myxococcus]|uniref:peptidoglycan-binding domain-containing protein n=1 Tax=Myxococcus TaxID=32 RepID=UPI001CED3984|nr:MULTISPECIES: peptidoglycan-binding domain-containing protein [Myxococcus]UYI17868.1 peptidoglycan-binding protein [Myxococcus xanthus]UYI25320.1 peptidoglycan-binding protein [Myxococcus xanthus]